MSKPSGKMVSLTLVDLSSPTALLAIGIGLSFLVFLIEIILFLKTKKRKIQEENNAVKNLLFGLWIFKVLLTEIFTNLIDIYLTKLP